MGFLSNNAITIIFYLVVFFIIYRNRKKFEVQSKIFFLYKTKIGLKFMEKMAQPLSKKLDNFGGILFNSSGLLVMVTTVFLIINRFNEAFLASIIRNILFLFAISFIIFLIAVIGFKQFKKAGAMGIYVGFAGMIIITGFIFQGIYNLVFKPSAPAVLSPIIPGISIPGSPIDVPLFYGIIALFVVIVIHEFSHGLICRVHKLKVKSSGVGIMAILPLAFVEPDEDELKKADWKVQNSMFAAGPFSNILTAIFVLLLMSFVFVPLTFSLTEPVDNGVMVFAVEGEPAYDSNIGTQGMMILKLDVLSRYAVADKNSNIGSDGGRLITSVNGVETLTVEDFITAFDGLEPGKELILSNAEESFSIIPRDNDGRAYVGVNIAYLQLKEGSSKLLFQFMVIVLELFIWIYALSFGLGLANLLPLGPVDGGRMLHSTLDKGVGKKRALIVFSRITAFFLISIVVLILVPIFKEVVF
ncbi:MAG: site-2 protease family protein [archaeon]